MDTIEALPILTTTYLNLEDRRPVHLFFCRVLENKRLPLDKINLSMLSHKIITCTNWNDFSNLLHSRPNSICFHVSELEHCSAKEIVDMVRTTSKLVGLDYDINISIAFTTSTNYQQIKEFRKAGIFGLVPAPECYSLNESLQGLNSLWGRIRYWPFHLFTSLPGFPKDEEKSLLYVGNTLPQTALDDLLAELMFDVPQLKINHVDSLKNLFYHITTFTTKKIDAISFDSELFREDDIFFCNVLKTIKTLWSEFRPGPMPCIGVVVGDNTPPNILTAVMKFQDVDYIACRIGGSITYNDAIENAINLASGCFTTHPKIQHLLDKIDSTRSKKTYHYGLTSRQEQIFRLILTRGLSNKHIAKTLNISESAVKAQLTQIFRKLGVQTRSQLLAFSN